MAKRNKKLKKSIKGYKKEIEKHFEKLDKDILKDEEMTAKYHIKEIDKSLIASLEKRMELLSRENKTEEKENKELVEKYKKKLEEYKKKVEGL